MYLSINDLIQQEKNKLQKQRSQILKEKFYTEKNMKK